jgi:predicted TIM-barrel fold metal-dependent hydrolase
VTTSKDGNNEIHDMITRSPDRFVGLGTLPMQDVKAATGDLAHVMVHLGFKWPVSWILSLESRTQDE